MLLSGEIVHEDASAPGWIELNAGRITKVGAGPPPHQPDLTGTWISPGLVDLQVNGAQGYEVTDGPTALESIDRALLRCGTTSYLATIISTSDTIATEAVDAFSHHQASQHPTPLVGIHLEGPFLNPTRRGVHLAEVLQTPHLPLPTYYNHPLVRLVTLAPELPGSQYLIKELTARGIVVSLGHSAATADQAQQAADSGAKMVTHLFNGMTPFHHRQSDLVGWALAQSELSLGLIADTYHVSKTALALAEAAAGQRIVLVSDASTAAQALPGQYSQAGLIITRDTQGQVTSPDNTLAGSGIALADAVQNWTSFTAASPTQAIRAATYAPARVIGLPRLLLPGYQADLVVWNEHMDVTAVIFNGNMVEL